MTNQPKIFNDTFWENMRKREEESQLPNLTIDEMTQIMIYIRKLENRVKELEAQND